MNRMQRNGKRVVDLMKTDHHQAKFMYTNIYYKVPYSRVTKIVVVATDRSMSLTKDGRTITLAVFCLLHARWRKDKQTKMWLEKSVFDVNLFEEARNGKYHPKTIPR